VKVDSVDNIRKALGRLIILEESRRECILEEKKKRRRLFCFLRATEVRG